MYEEFHKIEMGGCPGTILRSRGLTRPGPGLKAREQWDREKTLKNNLLRGGVCP